MDKKEAIVPFWAMDSAPPIDIALLALPQTTPTSLNGLYEVFAAVGVAWAQLTGRETGVRRIMPRIVARETTPFASPVGLPIAPQATLADVQQCDVVIVSDLALETGLPPLRSWDAERAWLRERFEEGALIGSVCTGSLLLAASGLLDGEEATTHWSATDLFRQNFPSVNLRPERILCPTGPEHRIVTGGGPGAWEDLALYLIARLCGPEEASRIARIFVMGDRSDGQLVFSAMGRPKSHDDAVMTDAQIWLAEHYAEPHPVRSMVERSGLTGRTFKRRFRAATGYSPIDYVQALRIEEAKQTLETTRVPTDEVAHSVGYEDPAYFRRLFRRKTGITPSQYRRRFEPAAFFARR